MRETGAYGEQFATGAMKKSLALEQAPFGEMVQPDALEVRCAPEDTGNIMKSNSLHAFKVMKLLAITEHC